MLETKATSIREASKTSSHTRAPRATAELQPLHTKVPGAQVPRPVGAPGGQGSLHPPCSAGSEGPRKPGWRPTTGSGGDPSGPGISGHREVQRPSRSTAKATKETSFFGWGWGGVGNDLGGESNWDSRFLNPRCQTFAIIVGDSPEIPHQLTNFPQSQPRCPLNRMV